jgi:hypothetical protein
MYFAESKATTTVGSVSEETVVRTDADQLIERVTQKDLQGK